LLLKRR